TRPPSRGRRGSPAHRSPARGKPRSKPKASPPPQTFVLPAAAVAASMPIPNVEILAPTPILGSDSKDCPKEKETRVTIAQNSSKAARKKELPISILLD